jgi:hypothetical protein
MLKLINRAAATTFVFLAVAAGSRCRPAADKAPPKDFKDLDLGELAVKPVAAKKDPKTGFLVGGKNPTTRVESLKQINGRTIAELEKQMRPGAEGEEGSTKGFLGPRESLLAVLAADNRYVVEERGLTHQELARHLHTLGAIGFWQKRRKEPEKEFTYHGRRFKVTVWISKGYQFSPFRDGTKTDSEATVHNLSNGKKLHYSLLVPHMIERYGFYEGKGTPYRVDPRKALAVLDFLKKNGK